MTRRGFTLLEVMVAVTILGLGLTLILSSQAGMFASTRRIEAETIAVNLLRCRMGELEVELEKKGFPLIDQSDSGDCCEDEDSPGFACAWKIETVELPAADAFLKPEGEDEDEKAREKEKEQEKKKAKKGADDEEGGITAPALNPEAAKFTATPMGAQGLLGAVSKGTTSLSEGAGPEALASSLKDKTPGGPQGMVSMAMTLVYPNLKPMLEASIRKITAVVQWRDGEKDRELLIVQYVTNPLEGSLTPNIPVDPNDPNATKSQTGNTGSPAMGIGTTP